MKKFESHITCFRSNSDKVKEIGESAGWSFSAIDGDPVMGKQAYCYLTSYDTDGQNLHDSMKVVAASLEAVGITPLRLKIEEIIFDTKTNYDPYKMAR